MSLHLKIISNAELMSRSYDGTIKSLPSFTYIVIRYIGLECAQKRVSSFELDNLVLNNVERSVFDVKFDSLF